MPCTTSHLYKMPLFKSPTQHRNSDAMRTVHYHKLQRKPCGASDFTAPAHNKNSQRTRACAKFQMLLIPITLLLPTVFNHLHGLITRPDEFERAAVGGIKVTAGCGLETLDDSGMRMVISIAITGTVNNHLRLRMPDKVDS